MSNNQVSRLNLETININSRNIKGVPSLIHHDAFCTVVAMDKLPHSLFANIDFELKNYPHKLREEISSCQGIMLRNYLSFGDQQPVEYVVIPGWLVDFEKINTLTIDGALMDKDEILKKISLKTLVFDSLAKSGKVAALESIVSNKNLKYVVYNELSVEDISYLKQNIADLKVLQKRDYESKVNAGEIMWE